MRLENFQAELRHCYMGGGTGAIISGLIWLAAAFTALQYDIEKAFYLLFFGGMLIFPLSKLVLKFIFKKPAESKENPGGTIVMETVFPMLVGLLAAWLVLPFRPEWTFPLATLAVGAHYFGFRTAYGDWTYWVLATLMCALGLAAIFMKFPSAGQLPFAVAVVEILFGVWFIVTSKRTDSP